MARRISDARAAALKADDRFYIGGACKRGHVAPQRYTSTNACRACLAEMMRARRRPPIDEFDELLHMPTHVAD